MIGRLARFARYCLALSLCFGAYAVEAEPYLAVQFGFKCNQCHVNPTGGGLRTTFADVLAQTVIPNQQLATGLDNWTGQLGPYVRAGGDLRFDAQVTQVPEAPSVQEFSLEQTRVYLEANVIPDRFLAYVDEQVAPGGALNREAYVLYWSASHDWYLKAVQMYLPFGLRLQDVTAFVNQVSGIDMTTPDQGLEVGWEKGHWDAQLAVSNGTASGSTTSNGKQESVQVQYVETRWRLGLAANLNGSSAQGSRDAFGLFGGFKTGPIAWLAEADIVTDHSLPPGPGGGQKQLATLLEANYSPARGHNLKVTYEYLDPDRELANDQQTRWSFVYELTPIQFVQLRFGARLNDGIPQLASEHVRLYFAELHGFF
jgi:hypothetical protein